MALSYQAPFELSEKDCEKIVDDIISGYKNYQVVCTAIEIGLFDYLNMNKWANREDISQSLCIKGMLVKSFLQALVEIGLIVQKDKLYSNSVLTDKCFIKHDGIERSGWIKFSGTQNPNWSNLKETLTAYSDDKDNLPPVSNKEFIDYLVQRSQCSESQDIQKAVTGWDGFACSKSILDISANHASVAIALCQLNQHLTVKVIDKPFIDQYIKDYQMEGRITNLGEDVKLDSIEEEFDVVIASHYLYKHRKYLEYPFEKVYRLLKPGGLFVANHWFCEVGCTPEQSGILALDKAFLSFGHPLCHVETFSRFFINQGFSIVFEKDIPSIYGTSRLHVALKKPVGAAAAEKSDGDSVRCCDG